MSSKPVEIFRSREDYFWRWRCNDCGPLRGGRAISQPRALHRGLKHHEETHVARTGIRMVER